MMPLSEILEKAKPTVTESRSVHAKGWGCRKRRDGKETQEHILV